MSPELRAVRVTPFQTPSHDRRISQDSVQMKLRESYTNQALCHFAPCIVDARKRKNRSLLYIQSSMTLGQVLYHTDLKSGPLTVTERFCFLGSSPHRAFVQKR